MSSIQLTSADTGGSQFTARLNPGEIKIVYSAKIARTELDKCIGAPLDRNYYYVLENGIEYNHPSCFHIIPSNCICAGQDDITKIHFDSGRWARTSPFFKIGCLSGPGTMHINDFQLVCCCNDCPLTCNRIVDGYHPCICGERVRMQRTTTMYWCLPSHAFWFHNACGICGPKDGEAIYGRAIASHLAEGEAQKTLDAIVKAREAWSQRTGFPLNYKM